MEELWKAIPEYEGLYEVSNLGQVRSIDRMDNFGRKYKGRILKLYKEKEGYVKVHLSKNGKVRLFSVHRLVAQAFLLIPNGKYEIHHKDHDKHNNHAENLQWVTRSENVTLAYDSGVLKRKLSEKDEEFIRKYYKKKHKKYGGTALAKRFGVCRQKIYQVANAIKRIG